MSAGALWYWEEEPIIGAWWAAYERYAARWERERDEWGYCSVCVLDFEEVIEQPLALKELMEFYGEGAR